MNKDKLIVDALKKQPTGGLSPEFGGNMMAAIYAEAARRKKRNAALTYLLIGGTSVALITLAVLLLRNTLTGQWLANLISVFSSFMSNPLLGFSIYIAVIVLFLMVLDGFLRSRYRKKMKNTSDIIS